MPGDIIILHMCTKNYNQMMMVPEIWCTRDGLTDRQKSDMQAGALPKKK